MHRPIKTVAAKIGGRTVGQLLVTVVVLAIIIAILWLLIIQSPGAPA